MWVPRLLCHVEQRRDIWTAIDFSFPNSQIPPRGSALVGKNRKNRDSHLLRVCPNILAVLCGPILALPVALPRVGLFQSN